MAPRRGSDGEAESPLGAGKISGRSKRASEELLCIRMSGCELDRPPQHVHRLLWASLLQQNVSQQALGIDRGCAIGSGLNSARLGAVEVSFASPARCLAQQLHRIGSRLPDGELREKTL